MRLDGVGLQYDRVLGVRDASNNNMLLEYHRKAHLKMSSHIMPAVLGLSMSHHFDASCRPSMDIDDTTTNLQWRLDRARIE
jgi:hypothetical protein